ncbi:hypothetical protein [Salegentibacter sp. Hel_I_6]|uniref:hypothetical protein n=1 Tax=Salegentibacter sp. Hel_I_6 TaxID=1250278 RepID=UPI000562E167|nr:hypothetical protein [Salegentibacter sp. Hel_I_6]
MSGKIIELQPGIYSVKVLGGWKVKTGDFSLELRHIDSDLKIKLKKTFWRIQSFAFKSRAKKIGSVDIPKWGSYSVQFKNANHLKIKKSNLFLISSFQKFKPIEEIQIIIG